MFRCQTHFPAALQGVNIVQNYNGSTKGILNWMLIKGMRMINTTVRKLLSTDEKTEKRLDWNSARALHGLSWKLKIEKALRFWRLESNYDTTDRYNITCSLTLGTSPSFKIFWLPLHKSKRTLKAFVMIENIFLAGGGHNACTVLLQYNTI